MPKKARGTMARQIILNRLNDPGQLKSLEIDGYLYNDSMSNATEMLFTKE